MAQTPTALRWNQSWNSWWLKQSPAKVEELEPKARSRSLRRPCLRWPGDLVSHLCKPGIASLPLRYCPWLRDMWWCPRDLHKGCWTIMIKQGQNLDELATQFAKVGSMDMCGYDMCQSIRQNAGACDIYIWHCWLHLAPWASISESIDGLFDRDDDDDDLPSQPYLFVTITKL